MLNLIEKILSNHFDCRRYKRCVSGFIVEVRDNLFYRVRIDSYDVEDYWNIYSEQTVNGLKTLL